MQSLFRNIAKWFLFFLILLLGAILIRYLSCPVYVFDPPKSFSGEKIYNPYQTIDSNNWLKGNFQVQSKAWGGVTDGRKNSSELINKVYSQLGYDIITISDYQKINRFGEGNDNFIPVYEHGYGIEKNHHVVIGARKIVWLDYPFFQNLNQKQHVLDRLRTSADLVYIAHPSFSKDYDPKEMKYLSNYDGIEVLNGFRKSVAHWDSALSAGRYVTILANDDAHDVSNPDEVGQFCTFINAHSVEKVPVIEALKQGMAFGAEIPRPLGEPIGRKALRHTKLPVINKVDLTKDTLTIQTNTLASEFRFIGQNGSLKARFGPAKQAGYVFLPDDPYIRTEIEYPDGTTYYLNPLARYNAEIPSNPSACRIDKVKTFLIRGLSLAGLIGLWLIYRRKIRLLLIMPLILVLPSAFAQDTMPDLRKEILYPGYLISLSDDTLAGMVMFKSLTRNQTEVVFYDSVAIGHNPRIAKPGEINGYVISGMNYRSVPFSGRYSSRKMTFMYCLADGPVSVYKWFFHEKQQYFEDNAFWDYKTTYAVDDIQHQFFVCRKNSKPLVISDCEIEFRFEKKMIRYLSDNKMIASKIKEKQPGYRCNDLVRIINEYNSR